MNLKRLFLVAILLASLGGCTVAPQPVYRATPMAGTDIWYDGKELVAATVQGMEMVLVFDGYRHGLLVFQAEFLNHSDKAQTIDPALFFYCEKGHIGAETISLPDSLCHFANDPEKRILNMEKARSRQLAYRQSQTDTDALFGFLDFVGDVASTNESKTEQQKQTAIQQDQEMELIKAREAREHETRMGSLDAAHYRWSKKALRKTTLGSGNSIGGLVFFRVQDFGDELTMYFPVGDRRIEADFHLEKIPVKSR